MSGSKISEILTYTIPDDMREMTAEEHAKYFPRKNEENIGLLNNEQHTVFCINYKKRPFLIGAAATLEATLKTTERNISRHIPNYRNTGYGKRIVDGKEILTFTFEYTNETGKHLAEYGLYRTSKYFCAFQCLYSDESKEFAESKYEEFLSSMKFNM